MTAYIVDRARITRWVRKSFTLGQRTIQEKDNTSYKIYLELEKEINKFFKEEAEKF